MRSEDAGVYVCRYDNSSAGADAAEDEDEDETEKRKPRLVLFLLDTLENTSYESVRDLFPDLFARLLTARSTLEKEAVWEGKRPVLNSSALNYETYIQWSMWSVCNKCLEQKENASTLTTTTKPRTTTTKPKKKEEDNTQSRYGVCRVRPMQKTRPDSLSDLFLLVHERLNGVAARCSSGAVAANFWPGVHLLPAVSEEKRKCDLSCPVSRFLYRELIEPLLNASYENAIDGVPVDDDLVPLATVLHVYQSPFATAPDTITHEIRVQDDRQDFTRLANGSIVERTRFERFVNLHEEAIVKTLRREWRQYPFMTSRKDTSDIPDAFRLELKPCVGSRLALYCSPPSRHLRYLFGALPDAVEDAMRAQKIDADLLSSSLSPEFELRRRQLQALRSNWSLEVQWLRDFYEIRKQSDVSHETSNSAHSDYVLLFKNLEASASGLYTCEMLLRHTHKMVRRVANSHYAVLGRTQAQRARAYLKSVGLDTTGVFKFQVRLAKFMKLTPLWLVLQFCVSCLAFLFIFFTRLFVLYGYAQKVPG